MEIDLSEIGMHKGQQYEIIITSIDKEGNSNAAPFGLRVLENDEIFLRIFDGGMTIQNIKDKREFIVNVTDDPLMFTLSSIDTIPEKHLSKTSKTKSNNELPFLTNADAYFICEVKELKSIYREHDPIKDTGIDFIKGKVVELNIKNKCVKPLNRAIHALIESLVNYSRINIVDDETQHEFLNRFLESERIVKRVGNSEEKEAIQILREDLLSQGFELEKK